EEVVVAALEHLGVAHRAGKLETGGISIPSSGGRDARVVEPPGRLEDVHAQRIDMPPRLDVAQALLPQRNPERAVVDPKISIQSQVRRSSREPQPPQEVSR